MPMDTVIEVKIQTYINKLIIIIILGSLLSDESTWRCNHKGHGVPIIGVGLGPL